MRLPPYFEFLFQSNTTLYNHFILTVAEIFANRKWDLSARKMKKGEYFRCIFQKIGIAVTDADKRGKGAGKSPTKSVGRRLSINR